MKTLVIVSHPEYWQSGGQQFFRESITTLPDVTLHHLEGLDKGYEIYEEQELLRSHDRIILQFPMYWYSCPYTLKKWLDDVLTSGLYREGLKGKELGIVVTLGVAETNFQAGASERYTLSELLRPFEAIANKCGMTYLPIFPVSQFAYMSDKKKEELLVAYQRYLTQVNQASFVNREKWLVTRLEALEGGEKYPLILDSIQQNRDYLDDLHLALKEMEE